MGVYLLALALPTLGVFLASTSANRLTHLEFALLAGLLWVGLWALSDMTGL